MSDLEKVEVLLAGLDKRDIHSLLHKYNEVKEVSKQVTELLEIIKTNIKIFLKEKNWDRYVDKEAKISVSLEKQKREVIDKQQLKYMITDAQYAQIINITTFEKLSIITPEIKARLSRYVRKKKV